MNVQLQPKQDPGSSSKLILLVALGAAVVIGAILFLWIQFSRTERAQSQVEGLAHKGDAEYEKYLPLVTVATKKATVQRNYAGQRTVLVSGVVHNGSDRWLEALEVRITLFRGEQSALQQTRSPLAPGSQTKPVPPQGDFSFTVLLDKIPPDWTGGSFDVELSGFKLGGK